MGRKSKEIKELERQFEEEMELGDFEEDYTEYPEDEEPELCDYMGKEYFDIEDYE